MTSPPLLQDCLQKDDRGTIATTNPSPFTHSHIVSGQRVCLTALCHGDQLYIFLSPASFAAMRKEWLVRGCVHMCLYCIQNLEYPLLYLLQCVCPVFRVFTVTMSLPPSPVQSGITAFIRVYIFRVSPFIVSLSCIQSIYCVTMSLPPLCAVWYHCQIVLRTHWGVSRPSSSFLTTCLANSRNKCAEILASLDSRLCLLCTPIDQWDARTTLSWRTILTLETA